MKTGRQRRRARKIRELIPRMYSRKLLSDLRLVHKTLERLLKPDEAPGEGSIVTFKKL